MTQHSEDLALHYLLTQQALETVEVAPVVRTAPAKVSKLAKVTAQVMAVNPPSIDGKVSTVVIPSRAGSVAGAGFMKLYRSAKNRQEVIEAIDLYIGYNAKDSFAAQELRAKQQAANELNPHRLTASGVSKVSPTVQGFIAGLPDTTAKHRENLLARERLAADLMIQHEKSAAEFPYESAERKLHEGLAEVECQRLQAIRHDLAQLG